MDRPIFGKMWDRSDELGEDRGLGREYLSWVYCNLSRSRISSTLKDQMISDDVIYVNNILQMYRIIF